MYGKRLALGASVVALVVGVSGALSNSSGQSSQHQRPIAYAGKRAGDSVWLRLNPSRESVADFNMSWEVAPERCSDRHGYLGILFAGSEWDHYTRVSAQGNFSETTVERYRYRGRRIIEHQIVTGTITDDRASGTLRGRVKISRRNGRVVRCTFGPQNWSALN